MCTNLLFDKDLVLGEASSLYRRACGLHYVRLHLREHMHSYITAVVLLLGVAAPSAWGQTPPIREKVAALNHQAMNNLGVSLNALRYLAGAKPGTYIPLWYLEQSGDIEALQELEKAGYAKVTRHSGLPDGQQKGTTFVAVSLIGEGAEIQKALLTVQPNRSFKPDGLQPRP